MHSRWLLSRRQFVEMFYRFLETTCILSGFMKKSKAKLMSECDHELAAVLFSREKDKNRTRVEKITSEADAIRKRQILPTQ